MNKRNQPRQINRKVTAAKRTPRRWPIYMLMLTFAMLIVSGFFFAGRQHFSSMDYGMKNSRLRKQVDELEAEKRRLILAREISLSPAEIKRAAKKTGLSDIAEQPVEVAQTSTPTKNTSAPTTSAPDKSLIVKTAAISRVPATAAAVYTKPEKLEKQIRKNTLGE